MDYTAKIGELIAARGVEVHDIRSRLPRNGSYPRLGLKWGHTAVHYTAAWRERDTLEREIRSWFGHASYHVNTHKWPAIAYCIGISPSGRAFLMRDVEEMGYHAFNANEIALAVACDTTQGQVPTPEMLRTLNTVLVVLHEDCRAFLPNLGRKTTWGHQELKWYDARNGSTRCPGDELLRRIGAYRGGMDFAPVALQATTFYPDRAYIKETDKWIINPIYEKWSAPRNNVFLYGYPLTGMYARNGEHTQVFERIIMHGNGPVHLALCGVVLRDLKYGAHHSAFVRRPAPASTPAGVRYFPETGHFVAYGFLSFWNQFGGVAQFGYPISEEFTEDGKNVQYFERARFEWHPGSNAQFFDVQLGLLGREILDLRGGSY